MGGFVDQGLHLWIASVPDALVLVDARGRIIEANAAMASLFGYREEELLFQSIEMLVPERLREVHARRRAEREGKPRDRPMGSDVEILARRKDGSEFRADIELCTREMRGGMVTVAVVRELGRESGLQEVEGRLVRLRDRLETTLDSPCGQGAANGALRAMREEAEAALELLRAVGVDGPRE